MKHIDDLFRDGLSGRKGDVPADLWSKIKAAQPSISAGEQLDKTFSDALRDREAPVPIGMWGRIVAARAWPRRRAYLVGVALLLLLFGLAVPQLISPDSQGDTSSTTDTTTAPSQPTVDQPVAATVDPPSAEMDDSKAVLARSAGAREGGGAAQPGSDAAVGQPDPTNPTNGNRPGPTPGRRASNRGNGHPPGKCAGNGRCPS